MIRTFIAIELAPAIRHELGELQARLGQGVEGIKWVGEENIHLTLKFLGDVDPTSVYEICKVTQRVAAGHDPVTFRVAGVGAFPHLHRPRVLWAGIDQGRESLSSLHDDLALALEEIGFPYQDRRFTPHLTLGRFRQRSKDIAVLVDRYSTWQGGEMTAHEAVVMASDLTSDGPRYSVMGRASLG